MIPPALHKETRRNGWIAERLNMGTEYGTSRYVAERLEGKRNKAMKLYGRPTANSKD